MYKIVRMFFNRGNRTIKSGLTLEEVQKHCRNPETSSSTCTRSDRKKITAARGAWFDGYEECSK